MSGGWWWVVALAVLAGLAPWALRRGRRPSGEEQGAYAGVRIDASRTGAATRVPREYSPKNVGNDASARPWEVAPAAVAPSADAAAPWPPGFDAQAFLEASKANFLSLQQAWDRADVARLRAMMTEGMLQQLQSELEERERLGGAAVTQTEVLVLDAQLLGVEDRGDAYVASVEFSGMSRDQADAGPSPFREIWSITRPKAGEGAWLVSGVQALQPSA
jgi:predicted lipid-binding transport protein (Tim44 family)